MSTLRILDCDPLLVPSEGSDRLTGATLEAALAAHPDPTSVCAVAATGGTTNAGIVDDLAGLADVAAARRTWLHVDAAYGGAAVLAPSARGRFAGIERADSVIVDPHKWLYAPFDSCALLYRDPGVAKSVHAQQAAYLDPIRTADEWNPTDYAYQLSRRARGLPLWYSLAVHGLDAYRDAIERVLALTQLAADRVRSSPHADLVRDPELSVLLWRRPGWTDHDYAAWSRRLLEQQVAFCLPTRWKGQTVARAVFLHPETTIDVFDEVLASMA